MRIKIFYHDQSKTIEQFQDDIDLWLMENQNIEIISKKYNDFKDIFDTSFGNIFNTICGSFVIKYKESDVGNDADEVD